MNANEPVQVGSEDGGVDVVELLERAERSLRDKHDDKYYASEAEILAIAREEANHRIEQDLNGNWMIQIVYEGIMFIHVTDCALEFGRRGRSPEMVN